MIVVGCDPGPTKSAVVCYNGVAITHTAFDDNIAIETWMDAYEVPDDRVVLVIEKIESFGMAVGAEVFETVFHSGRFAKTFEPFRVDRVSRRVVKQHICHTARATDANIRQALLDRFGGQEKAIGKKAQPGPLYHLKGHLWAAFAVAVTWYDLEGHIDRVRPNVVAEF